MPDVRTHPSLPAAANPEPGLAVRLREGTREAHRAAERVPFVRAFLRGELDRPAYRAYLVALWHVYAALEAGLERHHAHPVVGPLALPMLYRAPAIADDLRRLFDAHPTELDPVPAALAYAANLQELTWRAPSLLVAHAYTRYLGDLSGGQILRGAAARLLGLAADDPALAFYDFPRIPDLDACKADLRARLDALPLNPAGVAAMVSEARRAFAGNAAIFAELPLPQPAPQ